MESAKRQAHLFSPIRLVRKMRWAVALIALLIATMLSTQTALADAKYMVTAASLQNQTTQVSTAFAENMAVVVVCIVPGPGCSTAGVNVTFTVTPAGNGASGTFATTGTGTVTVVSGADGLATAPVFTANAIEGSYSVTVKAQEANPDEAIPNFFFLSNSSASGSLASQISTGNGSNQAALINTSFATQFSAIVFNGSGGFVVGVPVTFSAPASGASGTFAGTGTNTVTVNTGSTGVATAPTFTANGTFGIYFVEASVSGDDTSTGEPLTTQFAVRNSVSNVIGVPDIVSASAGNGQQVGAFAVFPIDMQVVVLDGSLNYVQGASVTFTAPASGPSGTFTGGGTTYTTTSGATGLATAIDFTANGELGGYGVQVSATKDGVTATGVIGLSNGRVRTTTAVTFSPAGSSVYGQPVTVSATVLPEAGSYVPAGPVDFYQGGVALAGCANVAPSGGVATCTLNTGAENTWLTPGNYTFRAEYEGDDLSQPSSAPTVSYTVNKADTSVALVSSHPTFALVGDTVTFTATVSPDAPGAGLPLGTINFVSSDGTTLGSVTLVGGVATISTDAFPAGTPLITATYGGNSNFNGSNESITQNIYMIPEVTDDPDDTTVVDGNTATFTAAAIGFPPPSVQWQVSTDGGGTFADIPGATSATFSFTVAQADDQNQYQAVFTNPAGADTSASAILTVVQPPVITSDDSVTFTVGIPGSHTVTATGIPTPTLALTSGTLPDGVTFDPTTGVMEGTPAVGTGGTYALQFTATNDVDPDAVQDFTLTVNEAPAFTSDDATSFPAGSAGSFTVTVVGFPVPTLALDSGTLPAGVTFDPVTGALAGTTAPDSGGTYPLVFTATNGIGPDATQNFTLTVDQAPVFTSVDSTSFTVGSAGSFDVTVDGFPAPTLALTSGSLPDGVAFDPATGSLSGTAAAGSGGTYSLEFTASNGIGTDAVQDFTLTVIEAPVFTSVDATIFTVGSPGSFTVTAAGFPAPTLSIAGTLPSGVTFTGLGELSGTPAESGVFPLTFTAANGIAPDAVQEFTLTVDKISQAPLVLIVTPGSGSVGDTLALSTTGGSGTGAVTFSVGGSSACSVAGDQLLLTSGDGSCQVTATKAEDDTYSSETSEPVTVAIDKSTSDLSVGDASGTSGGTTTLTATLSSGGTGLEGRTVNFSINGTGVGSATTGADGVATLANASLAGIAEGSYPGGIGADFAGDASHLPVSGTGDLTVGPAPTEVPSELPDQHLTVTGDPRFPVTGSAAIPGVEGVTYALNTSPTYGSVVVAPNGSFTYTAASTLVSSDTFTVLATAEDGNTALITVTITLQIDKSVPTYGDVQPGSGGGGSGGDPVDARSPSSSDNEVSPTPTPVPTPTGDRVQR
jgi:hypothetical protein